MGADTDQDQPFGINAVLLRSICDAVARSEYLASMLERGVIKAGVDLDTVGSIQGSAEQEKLRLARVHPKTPTQSDQSAE
jgi:gamma-glutamyl phosphate reductase